MYYAMYHCRSCNKKVASNALVCPNCGDNDCIYNKKMEEAYKEDGERRKVSNWIIIIGTFLIMFAAMNFKEYGFGGFVFGTLVASGGYLKMKVFDKEESLSMYYNKMQEELREDKRSY